MLSRDSSQNEKDLIREKIAQQFQKNMSQNEQDLTSEPVSNSLQSAVRRTCYHEIALKSRGKATAYDHRGPARS